MHGANALIAMRKRRYVPGLVCIDAETEPLPMAKDWDEVDPNIAHLQLAEGGTAERADMRCVVGLTVFVSGPDRGQVHALRDAAINAKAARVVAFCGGEVSDTMGVFNG